MRLSELDTNAFSGMTIFLDVDGTLVADKESELAPEVAQVVKTLAQTNDVYLASNGNTERVARIGETLGVRALPSLRKPLPHPALRSVERKPRTVVIGDKFLTDRLFALAIGAEFIMVERLRADTDDLHTLVAYSVDTLASRISYVLTLMRPHQWIKNVLVFAPLFFAHALFVPSEFLFALAAFAVFSVAASCIYVLNDILDREEDRLHPQKSRRPLAARLLSLRTAWGVFFILGCIEAVLLALSPVLLPVMLLYIVVNMAYSLRLKHVPVIDILCVAAFYIMRLVAGSVATAIPLSPWIVLCVFFVSLFVIVGKRRAEYANVARRRVLDAYSKESLDAMLSLSAGLAIISYALYTVLGRIEPSLIYSTVFVALALLRVLNDIYSPTSRAETPEKLLFKDPWILGSFLAWGAYLFVVFYTV